MAKTLIITEKGSVARAIRAVIGQDDRYIVEACEGHIIELAEPESYDPAYKRWDAAMLPIIPEKWKMEVKKERFYRAIKARLDVGNVDTVIHAGDPDAEGQAIVDEVLEMANWSGRTLRILPNSTDAISLRRELDKPHRNEEFLAMWHQAKARARADWLVGMNLTRAMTKLISRGALVSIGRVQTPTLALLVRRQREIDNFVQQIFYTYAGGFIAANGQRFELGCEPDPRIFDCGEADRIAALLKGSKSKAAVSHRQIKRSPPMPFDLQSFQSEAEACYGWGMERSLKALQASYEKGYTSYPRTDCRFLKEEQAVDVPRLVRDVGGALGLDPALAANMKARSEIYNSAKVKAHHGLAPTGEIPSDADGEDILNAWRLVSAQFLRALLPKSEFSETRVVVSFPSPEPPREKFDFSKLFSRRTSVGCWMDFPLDALAHSMRQKKPKQEIDPPAISNGDAVVLSSVEVREGKTTPPEPYTSSLLGDDMEAIWKFVKDPKAAELLKDRGGIGTPATRTPTIKALLDRGYVAIRKVGRKEILYPTELGCQVIDNSPAEIHSPDITAQWEEALRMIGDGTYTIEQFEDRIKRMVIRRIEQIKAMKSSGATITAENKKAPARDTGDSKGKDGHGSRNGKPAAGKARAASSGGRKPARK